ncbi:tetratricopeptide repeat protein [Neobacillus sp. NPDC058068]|uniref:tetratricopeptide repeat protein n=1 Tax=Neobacillus sp. NPDC058068 TaxID=3346325 RepID=UPI0036D7B22E
MRREARTPAAGPHPAAEAGPGAVVVPPAARGAEPAAGPDGDQRPAVGPRRCRLACTRLRPFTGSTSARIPNGSSATTTPTASPARHNLAIAHWQAGHTGEAIAIEERVLTDREHILGHNHPDTLAAVEVLRRRRAA